MQCQGKERKQTPKFLNETILETEHVNQPLIWSRNYVPHPKNRPFSVL